MVALVSSSRESRVDHTSSDNTCVESTMPLTWWPTLAAAGAPTRVLRRLNNESPATSVGGGGQCATCPDPTRTPPGYTQ